MLATIFLPVLMLFQVPSPLPAATATQRPQEQAPQTRPSPVSDEPPVVKQNSVRVGGRALNYTTSTGFMPIKNAVTGETEARIFFIAYTLDGVSSGQKRPLMFSFNGGPGSASVWLHLGALGPRRIKMLDDGMQG